MPGDEHLPIFVVSHSLYSRLFLRANSTGNTAISEIFEKFGVWIHDHYVPATLETRAICFKTTVKLMKFRVLTKYLRINLGRLGVAFTTNFFCIAISFSQNNSPLTIRIRTDFLRFS